MAVELSLDVEGEVQGVVGRGGGDHEGVPGRAPGRPLGRAGVDAATLKANQTKRMSDEGSDK